MKTILLALSLSLAITQPAGASLITFEDLFYLAFPGTYHDSPTPVPQGYNGFEWEHFYPIWGFNQPCCVSGIIALSSEYNINLLSPPSITCANGTFVLNSAYLTSRDNDNPIEVVGLYHGTILYDNSYGLNSHTPTKCTFNFAGIDTVLFEYFCQDSVSSYQGEFGMDNLVVNENEALIIPETRTDYVGALLLLPLVIGLFQKLRKKPTASQQQ